MKVKCKRLVGECPDFHAVAEGEDGFIYFHKPDGYWRQVDYIPVRVFEAVFWQSNARKGARVTGKLTIEVNE